METTVISKLIEASPYLGFVLIWIWFESQREDKRVANAAELEDKREKHELALEEKREAHDRDVNNMWASYIKSLLDKQTETSERLLDALHKHEEASQDRYDRIGITQDLIDAVKESKRQRAEGKSR